jgi:hypothetical protein
VLRTDRRVASRPGQTSAVIVALHVASGGLTGGLAGSRVVALLLGPPLHVAADRIPHQDIASRRFEIVSGSIVLGLFALRCGPLDPVTLGAAASSAPDLEHLFRRLRPRGRKLFHRGGMHHGGVPVSLQLLAAGLAIGFLLGPRTRAADAPE